MSVTISPYCTRITATLPGVRAEVRTEAKGVANRAKAIFASHDQPGGATITTSRGSIDFFANLEGDGAGAIEWGGVKADGTVVPGLHVMRRAAGLSA